MRSAADDFDELDDPDDSDELEPYCCYCGCTDGSPCFLETGPCSWFKRPVGHFAVCSAPACVQAYLADETAP